MGIREALNIIGEMISSLIKGIYELIRGIIKDECERKKKERKK